MELQSSMSNFKSIYAIMYSNVSLCGVFTLTFTKAVTEFSELYSLRVLMRTRGKWTDEGPRTLTGILKELHKQVQ